MDQVNLLLDQLFGSEELDFDEDGNIVSMEIEDASKRVDLSRMEITYLPEVKQGV